MGLSLASLSLSLSRASFPKKEEEKEERRRKIFHSIPWNIERYVVVVGFWKQWFLSHGCEREREEEGGKKVNVDAIYRIEYTLDGGGRWPTVVLLLKIKRARARIFILLFFSSELSFSLDEREKERDRRDYFLRDFVSAMVFLLSFTRTSRNTSSINEIKKVFVQHRCDTIDTWRPRFHEEEIFFFLDGI